MNRRAFCVTTVVGAVGAFLAKRLPALEPYPLLGSFTDQRTDQRTATGSDLISAPRKVEVHYGCGHIEQLLSPSVNDPSGVWSELPICPDDVIRITGLSMRCFNCLARRIL